MTALASLCHLAIIAGGPNWYRFFGAGEQMAQAAEKGAWFPAIVTVGIAGILAIWAAYAFSAAGLIGRLPMLKFALVGIAAVFLLRGAAGLFPGLWRPDLSLAFKSWSSAIVSVIGLFYAIAIWREWNYL
jgi:hypothetical protein